MEVQAFYFLVLLKSAYTDESTGTYDFGTVNTGLTA